MSGEHNLDAEERVLGAILLHNEAFVFVAGVGLEPQHFFEPLYQAIFAETQRKIGLGQLCTPVTLRDSFPDLQIEGQTLSQVLARLCAQAPAASTAADYAQVIVNLATKRAIVDATQVLVKSPESGVGPDEAIRGFYETIDLIHLGVLQANKRQTAATMHETVQVTIDQMDAVIQGTNDETGSIPTGLAALDDRLGGGLHPGELVICAGRPGMGKSALSTSLARQIALPRRYGVGFFSLEMPKIHLGRRILTDHAFTYKDPIEYRNLAIRDPLLSVGHQERIHLAKRDIDTLPIEFDFASYVTVSELTAKARAMAAKIQRSHSLPMGVLFIDYLKFVKATDRYKGHRVYELGEITASLKALARDLGICVFLLAQLNREVEKTADKRPDLSHLRDSGDLEADTDVVLFLFREHYYLKNDPKITPDILSVCENKLEVNVAKQRMGPTGLIELYCHMGASAIRGLEDRDRQPMHALSTIDAREF